MLAWCLGWSVGYLLYASADVTATQLSIASLKSKMVDLFSVSKPRLFWHCVCVLLSASSVYVLHCADPVHWCRLQCADASRWDPRAAQRRRQSTLRSVPNWCQLWPATSHVSTLQPRVDDWHRCAVDRRQKRSHGDMCRVWAGLVFPVSRAVARAHEVLRLSTWRQVTEGVGAWTTLRTSQRTEVPEVQGRVACGCHATFSFIFIGFNFCCRPAIVVRYTIASLIFRYPKYKAAYHTWFENSLPLILPLVKFNELYQILNLLKFNFFISVIN